MPDIDRMLSDAVDAGRGSSRPLPPSDVRGVGDRMRRTRTALTASFSAAAVAGVVGVVLTTTGSGTGTTPGPDDVAGPSGDAVEIQAQLLTEADVTDIYSLGGALGLLEPQPSDVVCEPIGSTPLAEATTSFAWTTSGTGERVVLAQGIERVGELAAAIDRFAEVGSSFRSCGESGGASALSGSWTVTGIADESSAVVTIYQEQGDQAGRVQVAYTARSADVVTWLTLTSVSPEPPAQPDVEVLAAAVERLCAWAGGACATDAVDVTLVTPEVPAPDALLIIEDDVATAVGGTWSQTPGVEPDPSAPSVVCMPGFIASGAEELTSVGYTVDGEPSDGTGYGVSEIAARFPDEASAAAYLDSVRTALSPCEDAGVPFLPIEGVADAWLLDFDTDGTAYGFRQRGEYVVLVEQRGEIVEPGAFFALLDLASARLTG